MAFAPVCKEIITQKQKKLKDETIKIGVSVNSGGQTIKQVLSVNALPRVNEILVMNGMAEVQGVLHTQILVVNNDNEYQTIEDLTNFNCKVQDSEIVDNAKILAHCTLLDVQNVVANETGVSCNVSLIASSILLFNSKLNYIEDVDNLACKRLGKIKYTNITNSLNQNFEVVSEANLPNSISKILFANGDCVLQGVSVSNDMLTANGKINVNLVFLTNDEKPKLKSQEYSLDFNEEFLLNGAKPENLVVSNVVLNAVECDVQGEMNSSKGVLTIKSNLSLLATLSEEGEVDVVVDAFCPNYDLVFEKSKAQMQNTNSVNIREKVDGSLSLIDDVRIDKILCVSNIFTTHSFSSNKENTLINGVLHANIIYCLDDEEGTIGAVVADLPFSKVIDENNINNLDVHIVVSNVDARSKRVKDVDIQAELDVVVNYTQNTECEIINKILLGNKINLNQKPFGVYVVNNADNVWEVAKMLKVNPELITTQNPTLSFPIQAPTNVMVYRQRI